MNQASKIITYLSLSLGLHIGILALLLLLGIVQLTFFAPNNPIPLTPPREQENVIKTILVPLQGPNAAFMPQQGQPIPPTPLGIDKPVEQTKPLVQAEPKTEPLEHVQEKPKSKPIQEIVQSEIAHLATAEKQLKKIENERPQQEKKQVEKPRRSIAKMTASFLQSNILAGNALQERDGLERMPSLRELKYLSYQQRIDEAIMTSWRMVRSKRMNSSVRSQSGSPVMFDFAINKNGSLSYVKLLGSSGNPEFDRLVILSIRHAAPFPPIPDHLGISTYRPTGGTYRVAW